MHTLHKSAIAFALCLSVLAGYVDAIGFLELGRTFISFMSGNSTQLAVGLMQGDSRHAGLLAGIIALFIAGATLGTVVNQLAKGPKAAAVLLFVTALLTGAALCHTTGKDLAAIMLMTLAMGAENAVLQRADDAIIGVTYMTGTLVKMGQRVAYALLGGDKFSWLPYLLLWLGLISGGAVGAVLFHFLGLHSIWIAAVWAAMLTIAVWI